MFQTIKEKLTRHITILNMLFVISGTTMTWLFSRNGIAIQEFKFIGILVSCIILMVLVFRFHFLEDILLKTNLTQTALALVFAVVTWYYYGYKCIVDIRIHLLPEQNISTPLALLGIVSAALASFSIFVWYSWIFERFQKVSNRFFRSLDRQEKIYLSISMFLAAVAILVVYSQTKIFYLPHEDNIVFNSDSSSLVQSNVYFFIEAPKNSIKQPLFGLYAMPFSVLARIISKLLFFIPNGYVVVLAIIQVFLLQISFVLISRMMNLKSASQILFLVLLNCTYPVFLFTFVYEQYLFAVFWLILFLYSYLFQKENNEYYFIGAAGSMLTSGILFPLLSNSKKITEWIREVFFNGGKFILAAAIFGQLPIILNPIHDIQHQLNSWTGDELTFWNKFLQYINFVATCFFKPEIRLNTKYLSYQLAPVRDLNTIGVIIMVVVIIGFILNHRKPFAKICMSWIIYSFVILCVIGWGTNENGLILYTLYFFWAFLSLAYMAVDSHVGKKPLLKYAFLGSVIITVLVINLPGILDLIQFGINYYYP